MKGLALILAAGQILAGCGWGQPSGLAPRPHHHRGVAHYPVVVHSPPVAPGNGASPGLLRESAHFVSPTRLEIVTLGSSSCPSVPDELVVESPHRIRIHLTLGSRLEGGIVTHPPPSGACTADYGETAIVVAIDPTAIDVHHPLTVRFFYEHSTTPIVRTAAPL